MIEYIYKFHQWYHSTTPNRSTVTLKVLLPKLKLDLLNRRLLARLFDISRRHIRPAEVHSYIRLASLIQARQVRLIQDPLPHRHKQTIEIGTSEIRSTRQLSQGILIRAYRVQNDVLCGVGIHLLRQIGVDPEELVGIGATSTHALALRFETLQESLEPFERRRVFADPDEFHTAQTFGWVG